MPPGTPWSIAEIAGDGYNRNMPRLTAACNALKTDHLTNARRESGIFISVFRAMAAGVTDRLRELEDIVELAYGES